MLSPHASTSLLEPHTSASGLFRALFAPASGSFRPAEQARIEPIRIHLCLRGHISVNSHSNEFRSLNQSRPENSPKLPKALYRDDLQTRFFFCPRLPDPQKSFSARPHNRNWQRYKRPLCARGTAAGDERALARGADLRAQRLGPASSIVSPAPANDSVQFATNTERRRRVSVWRKHLPLGTMAKSLPTL